MNLYKRIISLFLVFAICISSMVTVAFAADDRAVASGFTPADFSSAVSYGAAIDENFGFLSNAVGYLGTLREAMSTGSCDGCTVNPDGRHNFLPVDVLTTSWAAALKGGEACICRYCGITYDDFYDQTYNQYVSSLQTDLGTVTLIDGGIRLYPRVVYCGNLPSGGKSNTDHYGGVVPSEYPITCVMTWPRLESEYSYPWFCGGSVVAPFNCIATSGYSFTGGGVLESESGLTKDKSYAEGATVDFSSAGYGKLHVQIHAAYGSFGMTFTPYIDLIPTSDPLSSFATQDITINSRPTSIVGDYGIIGDDGTIIRVDGNMIVDESTSTVFNPVTNVTNNYTDYAFDYSDRSYNLTLEDGSTIKVVYGNENITIQEGDTIYNVYYLIPDDSGSGDDPGTGDTPSGEDMSWWKQAWTNFTDKLFSILGNGGSSVNPDNAPAVPDDEETGEKGYSVIDLFVVLKDGTWAFITGIVSTAYDGFTGFVESVSSAGSFFTFYDEESEDGILFVPLEGGETIWD